MESKKIQMLLNEKELLISNKHKKRESLSKNESKAEKMRAGFPTLMVLIPLRLEWRSGCVPDPSEACGRSSQKVQSQYCH